MKAIMRHILIVAGDPSGDQHGADLVKALLKRDSTLRISALGGTHLRKSGLDHFLYPLVGVGGFGFWEPFTKLPQLSKAWAVFKNSIFENRPDVVVPIDYYGFNVRVARWARQNKIPVAYYVSPQVWASRPGRVGKLAASVSKMLVIFPFEVALYEKAGVPVRFVGHPLTERLPAPGKESSTAVIGLLPGSRRSIAIRHLPILMGAAELLRKDFPQVKFVLFRPEEIEETFYQPFLQSAPWIEVQSDPAYETRRSLWLAIGVSGTAALENMLLGIPMVIMYKLSRLSYWIARALIRIPYVGIPNILAGRFVVPELIQDQATPEKLAEAARPLLADSRRRAEMRKELVSLRATLADGGSTRAADEILALIQDDKKGV
jgi:lipid-A-disaccharide synthase